MRVYIVYRHYWPDTAAYSRLLRSIVEHLAADGHEVEVFTGQPSYNDVRLESRPLRETVGGVRIVRMPLFWERKRVFLSRLVNSCLFLAGAIAYGLLRRRPDLVMTPSSPPALAATAARILSRCRGSRFLYHCQDLHPEAARQVGKLRGRLLYRLTMACEKAAHRDAAAVVVLSQDMAAAVRERGLPGDNLRILNSFILEAHGDEAEELPAALRWPGHDVYRILFAGNLGVFQGLEHVIDAARRLSDQSAIQFHFLGEGLAKPLLVRQAGDLVGRTVFFHPVVPVATAKRVMEECDLGLISLDVGLHRLAYPSKTMTLLAAGLPLLAVVEPESELARFIEREKIGWTCPPRDPATLAETISRSFAERARRQAIGERCRQAAAQFFGRDKTLEGWSRLLRELEAQGVDLPVTAES